MKTGLERLIEQVDLAHEEAASVEALARSVRAALQEHIATPGFALDCLERVLASPALADPGPVWRNPPIHANKKLNYKFRVFFWSPGYINWPHQHNTWSVTGVLHNQSSILVYVAADGPRSDQGSFIVERQLVARAGEVGYLLPGCTHSVGNPGDSISATFHIFSDSPEEERRRNDTIWYPTPKAENKLKGRRFKTLRGSAEMLANIGGPRSTRLLNRIFEIGGPKVKLACIKAMTTIDPSLALSRSEEFYASLPASSYEELSALLAAHRSSAQVH